MNKKYRPGVGVYLYLAVMTLSMGSTLMDGDLDIGKVIVYLLILCIILACSYKMWNDNQKSKSEETDNVKYVNGQKVYQVGEKEMTDAEMRRMFDNMNRRVPNKKEFNPNEIVRAAIIDNSASSYKTKTSATSAIGRAVVGDVIAGPVGSIIGAGTAKKSTQEIKGKKVRFLVEYADGKKKTEDVKVDSRRYKELIQYM